MILDTLIDTVAVDGWGVTPGMLRCHHCALYCVVCADAALVNIIVNGAGTQLRGGDVSRMRSPYFKGWLTKERAVVGISWWPGAIAQDLQHDLLTGSLLY